MTRIDQKEALDRYSALLKSAFTLIATIIVMCIGQYLNRYQAMTVDSNQSSLMRLWAN